MRNLTRQFEANVVGRDFAIGDLHGSYDIFLNLLANLQFDPEKDRMFSVGDLVDRGPESLACLKLMNEPWFHAVPGNHEFMMVDAFLGDGSLGAYWPQNGGMWGLGLYNDFQIALKDPSQLHPELDEFLTLLQKIEQSPIVQTVKLRNGEMIHMLHAEIPPTWVVTDEMLMDHESVEKMLKVQTREGDYFSWGRHRFYAYCYEQLTNKKRNARVLKNMLYTMPPSPHSHVLSGHTKVQAPLTLGKFTNIDTAAHESYKNAHGSRRKWAGLTCVDLNEWKFYKATDETFEEVQPVVVDVNDAKPGEPDDEEVSS